MDEPDIGVRDIVMLIAIDNWSEIKIMFANVLGLPEISKKVNIFGGKEALFIFSEPPNDVSDPEFCWEEKAFSCLSEACAEQEKILADKKQKLAEDRAKEFFFGVTETATAT